MYRLIVLLALLFLPIGARAQICSAFSTSNCPVTLTPGYYQLGVANGGYLGGTFFGSPTFSGAVTLNGGGALSGVFSGSPTFSGAVTLNGGGALSGVFSGSPTFSGPATWTSPIINGTVGGSGNIGALIVTPTGSTGTRTLSAITSSTINVLDYGLVCNSTTDDTSALTSLLASVSAGATIFIPAGQFCVINSGNITLPANVKLRGLSPPFGNWYSLASTTSGFLLNPLYSISFSNGSAIEDISIFRKGLTANPTSSQAISAVSTWGGETSVALVIPANISAARAENVFIEGFNTCISAYAGDYVLSNVWGDCYNWFYSNGGGDNHYIDNVRFEPFYSLNTSSSSGSWARPGIAFNLTGNGASGGFLTRVFSFMYASGLVMEDLGVTVVSNSGWEWNSTAGNGITGTVGVRWINHNAQTSLHATYSNGFDTCYSDESTGEIVNDHPSCPSATVTGFNQGGNSQNLPTVITITGTPSAGNTVSAVLTSSAITGSPLTVTYTAVAGDTTSTMATNLATKINATQALIAARFHADNSTNTLTIYWPNATTATATASSVGVTTATSSGTQQAGSYGLIDGADAIFNNVPIFTFAKNNLQTTISDLYLGSTNLFTGWLSASDASIAQELTLSGIPWAPVQAANFSSCGSGTITAIGNDMAFTVTEGTSATGCTYTFSVPVPTNLNDVCSLTSGTGTAITGYTISATQIAWTHTSTSNPKVTVNCRVQQ